MNQENVDNKPNKDTKDNVENKEEGKDTKEGGDIVTEDGKVSGILYLGLLMFFLFCFLYHKQVRVCRKSKEPLK